MISNCLSDRLASPEQLTEWELWGIDGGPMPRSLTDFLGTDPDENDRYARYRKLVPVDVVKVAPKAPTKVNRAVSRWRIGICICVMAIAALSLTGASKDYQKRHDTMEQQIAAQQCEVRNEYRRAAIAVAPSMAEQLPIQVCTP